MGRLQRFMEASIPGVYVHSIMVGDGPTADTLHGYFGNVDDQVKEQCARLLAEPRLANGFFALGFSQGSQFIRALVQRCGGGERPGDGKLIVRRLVTMGGQHAGVSDLPGCAMYDGNETLGAFCRAAEAAIRSAVYSPFTRASVVQAQYFRDPARYDEYLRLNPFLPDINNERDDKNDAYKKNLLALERLVLIRFSEDTVVVPRDSAWFGAYAVGSTREAAPVVELRDQPLYREDWIGLRALDESGRLVAFDCPGEHMHFTDEWFKRHVLDAHLTDEHPEVSSAGAFVAVE